MSAENKTPDISIERLSHFKLCEMISGKGAQFPEVTHQQTEAEFSSVVSGSRL